MKAMKLHQGRRVKKTKNKGKVFLITLLAIILVVVIILVLVHKLREEKTLEGEEPTTEDVVISKDHVEQFEMVDVSDMPEVMGGYSVIGKIVIDKLGVQKYILGRSTDESLNLAVAKFWGPHVNDPR